MLKTSLKHMKNLLKMLKSKDWGVLTQIGNVSVNKIHEFLNE